LSKDVVSSKKRCSDCGEEILDGQAYLSLAKNFKVGKETAYDLLTKSYEWEFFHDTTAPSRVKVKCISLKESF